MVQCVEDLFELRLPQVSDVNDLSRGNVANRARGFPAPLWQPSGSLASRWLLQAGPRALNPRPLTLIPNLQPLTLDPESRTHNPYSVTPLELVLPPYPNLVQAASKPVECLLQLLHVHCPWGLGWVPVRTPRVRVRQGGSLLFGNDLGESVRVSVTFRPRCRTLYRHTTCLWSRHTCALQSVFRSMLSLSLLHAPTLPLACTTQGRRLGLSQRRTARECGSSCRTGSCPCSWPRAECPAPATPPGSSRAQARLKQGSSRAPHDSSTPTPHRHPRIGPSPRAAPAASPLLSRSSLPAAPLQAPSLASPWITGFFVSYC